MTENNETNSTSKEGTGHADFKSCCGDSEKMSWMMRKFCSGEDKTFDCRAMMHMMQKMCCASPEKSGQ